jgi:branched-chain amino acid transport system ATP-binding protein
MCRRGEIVAILGRNGSGRSTTCKAMMGMLPVSAGSVWLGGEELAGRPSHLIARCGLGYVPEERIIFTGLTVEENLRIGEKPGREGTTWTREELYDLFPPAAGAAACARRLPLGRRAADADHVPHHAGQPAAILIDEPTEGLAPMIVDRVGETIRELRQRGAAVLLLLLLLEQKLSLSLKVADRVLIMAHVAHGEIVAETIPDDFRANPDISRRWLEVA